MCSTFLVGAHIALNPTMSLKAVCVMDSQSTGPVKGTITFTQEVTLIVSSLHIFRISIPARHEQVTSQLADRQLRLRMGEVQDPECHHPFLLVSSL